MRKLISMLLAVLIMTTLTACGGDTKTDENPTGNIADIDDGGTQQKKPDNTMSPDPVDSQPVVLPGVEVKDDRIVQTAGDEMGNTAVTEYIYKDGTLTEMRMTMKCVDISAAETLVDAYTTGELMEYGEQLYSEIKQDGANVTFKFKESQLASFTGLSMEQLAVLLEGGDPFSVASDDPGNDTGNEAEINITWDDMALPDGFPKLADGVTNYSGMNSFITISWSTMSQDDADSMAVKIEEWAGASADKTEMDGTVSWHLDSGTYIVDLNYYSDTFGGAMDQLILSIMKLE